TPESACARPSPVTTSTPLERDIDTTSCPWALSTATTWRPTLPVAPATAILLPACMRTLLVLNIQSWIVTGLPVCIPREQASRHVGCVSLFTAMTEQNQGM